MRSPTLEALAVSALMQLGATEPEKALAQLDETGVQPTDFGGGHVGAIATATVTLLRSGKAPDLVAIAELSRAPASEVSQVADALNTHLGWQPLKQYLEAVRDRSEKRRLSAAFGQIQAMLAEGGVTAGSAAAEAHKLLAAIQSTEGLRPLSGDLMKLIDHVEAVSRGDKPPVLETGLPDLDKLIGGLQPTLTVIGALPGVGKSALVAAILQSLLSRGVVSGLLSLEDEGQWVVRRLMAQASQVPVFVLANRPLGSHQLERFGVAAESLYAALDCVLVDDRSGLTTAEVVASARAMVARGAKAVFVDHLGEIRLERSDRHDLDIAEALRDLRALAKTYGVPVVVLAHLKRREGGAEEPKLTDFAFSAGVERMARVALALTRPKDSQSMRVHVLKQTQGVADVVVDLGFDAPSGMVTALGGA